MGATTDNALLKEDADALLAESGFEIALPVTFSNALDAYVSLGLDQHLAPGDDTDKGNVVINDHADAYGDADGLSFILEGISPRMGTVAAASAFADLATLPRFSRGLTGGPSFKTIIQETASGDEYRISKWQRPKRRYDIGNAIDTPEDFRKLMAHYKNVRGSLSGFRLRDPFDWSTHTNHMTKPDHTNYSHRQLIGAGDGTTTEYQIVKRYTTGSIQRVRPITHPHQQGATVDWGGVDQDEDYVNEVYVDGARQTSGFSVVSNGGKIVFDSAPAVATQIEWCGTFDVPVRFDQEIDQGLLADLTTDQSYSVQLSATEVSIGEQFSDHRWMGGVHSETIASDTALYLGAGRMWRITASTSGLKAYLPHSKHLLDGGPVMTIYNAGSNAFDIYPYYLSTSKLVTLAAGEHIHLMLKSDGLFRGIE